MIQQLTQEEALALAKGPLSGEVLRLAASTVQPLFWLTGPVGTGLMQNATTFFVDAGRGVFGVTAGHVYDAYLEHKRRGGGPCHVGMLGLTFDLETRLIDRGRAVDIATYRLRPAEVGRLGATIRHEPNWPPERPRAERGVFYAGYPAAGRKLVGERTIEWGLYGAAGIATSVNDQSIVGQMERDNLVELLGLPIPRDRVRGRWSQRRAAVRVLGVVARVLEARGRRQRRRWCHIRARARRPRRPHQDRRHDRRLAYRSDDSAHLAR